jgi:hypothetical protein
MDHMMQKTCQKVNQANHSSQKLIHNIPFFNAISHETGMYKISGCCIFFLHHKTTVGIDISGKKKVKCTLLQALRFCTGHTAHRGVEV